MTKQEYLSNIRELLKGMPPMDIDKALSYYREAIEDRMEDGLTEEEAVREIGTPEEAASQILREYQENGGATGSGYTDQQTYTTYTADPVYNPAASEPIRRRMGAAEIILLILGSPIWIPLLAAAFVLVMTAWLLMWVLIIVCYALVISFGAAAIVGLVGGFLNGIYGFPLHSLFLFGVSLCCIGLTILMVLFSGVAAKALARGSASLVKWFFKKLRRK